MALLDKFLAKSTPTQDEFAAILMKRFLQSGVENAAYDSAKFTMKAAGKTLFLENAYNHYCQADSAERDRILTRFSATWADMPEIPEDFASVRPCLMPVIRDAARSSVLDLDLQAKGGDPSTFKSAGKALFGPLLVGLAYDTEHTIHDITGSSIKQWGAGFDEALQQATDNLRAKTDPDGLEDQGRGLYRSTWCDSYDSARILMTDLIRRLPLDGDPIAFIPNRDQLWVTGSRNKSALAALLKLGEKAHFEPYSVSPDLFHLTNNIWQVYVPEDPALLAQSRLLHRHRNAANYRLQKTALDVLHETQGVDTFVASCNVFERPNGTSLSACVWTNGVDTLLPQAEYLCLLMDETANDVISVLWDQAIPVVGSLLKEEPDLLPKRYRARKFPNSKQLDQLRKLAAANPDRFM